MNPNKEGKAPLNEYGGRRYGPNSFVKRKHQDVFSPKLVESFKNFYFDSTSEEFEMTTFKSLENKQPLSEDIEMTTFKPLKKVQPSSKDTVQNKSEEVFGSEKVEEVDYQKPCCSKSLFETAPAEKTGTFLKPGPLDPKWSPSGRSSLYVKAPNVTIGESHGLSQLDVIELMNRDEDLNAEPRPRFCGMHCPRTMPKIKLSDNHVFIIVMALLFFIALILFFIFRSWTVPKI